MQFYEALKLLESGERIRRSTHSDISYIVKVDPNVDPNTDGPSRTFGIFVGNKSIGEEYTTQEEASKVLAGIRREHTNMWKDYEKAQKRWDAASSDERGKIPVSERPHAPGKGAEFWKDAEVKEKDPSRKHRINEPYLLAVHRSGVVQPYAVSHSDLFGLDWSLA
jgi:hypothetical protein